MPKVSVIVPVYGVEKYLDRCVRSLTSQTLRDIEIILVDDRSPDRCPQICDEWARKDNRIKVVHQKQNGGLGISRNKGLELAKGEYVSFVDSDDYVDRDLYEHVYTISKKEQLEICFFRHRRVDEDGNIYPFSNDKFVHDFYSSEEVKNILLEMMGGDPSLHYTNQLIDISASSCGGFYKHDIIKKAKVSFSSERDMASEDLIFHVNLLPHINRVKVLPNVYYNYFVNNKSISTSYDEKKFWRFIRLLDYLKMSLPRIYSNGSYNNAFVGYILNTFKVIIRFETWQNKSLLALCKRINEICGMEICKRLYISPVVKYYPLKDRIFVFCMKYRIPVFFIILYRVLYHKYGIKK